MASRERYHTHVEAFHRMLAILETEDLDVITLFELREGTPEYEFWIERYSDYEDGGKIHRDATWMYAMSEEEIRFNLRIAQQAHSSCVSA